MFPDRTEQDEYQRAWQAQSSQTRVTIHADLLLNELQRHERDFRATIFWRDFREVVVAILMIPVWFYMGYRLSLPWTWYLSVPTLLWTAGFMLVYRRLHPQRPSEPNEPLLQCIENSLNHVDDQIWLLRNVWWWYLLPPCTAMLTFFAHVTWQFAMETGSWLAALGFAAFLFGVSLTIYGAIYYVNQRAVRTELKPRRQELLTLLASLRDEEATSDGAADQIHLPGLPFAGVRCAAPSPSGAKVAFAIVAAVFTMLLLVGVVEFFTNRQVFTGGGYPKQSPFAAVRWEDSQPLVQVRGEWFRLVALNDLSSADIVAFSQRTFGDRWRKRFEEDLVELLTRMGHPPQGTVNLTVQPLTSRETYTLEDVPMTYANRRAIRDAAQARERKEQRQRRETAPQARLRTSVGGGTRIKTIQRL